VRVITTTGDPVVLEDHRRDLRRPFGSALLVEIRARQSHRRLQIVKGAVGPDAKIVKRRRESNPLELLRSARGKGDAQIDYAVRVVSVSREVAAQRPLVRMQHRVDRRHLSEQRSLYRRHDLTPT
jgi:hypothetical protein